jgi:hypothetical protein
VLFLTINPVECHSLIALFFAGAEIDIKNFHPEWFNSTMQLKTMLNNPLSVVEYFHTTLSTIIDTVVNGNAFGDLDHYYGTIEYQGRGTPHCYLAVNLEKI